MHNSIAHLFEKRGIKSEKELSPQERAKYEVWMRVFEKDIKVEDIKKFIQAELTRLEADWLETEDRNPFTYLFEWKRNIELKGRMKNYKALLTFLDEPDRNKKKLEKYLRNLINK